MKKILLISLISLSTNLISNDLSVNAQPVQNAQPTQPNQVNTSAMIMADVLANSFNPAPGTRIEQTPENNRAAHIMQRTFRRNLRQAIQERNNQEAPRPEPVVIPETFATDVSDTRRNISF